MKKFNKTLLTALVTGGIASVAVTGMLVTANAQTATSTQIATTAQTTTQTQREANRTAIQTALTNADYSAWKSAVQSSPRGTELLAKIDTQDKFNKLVEAHKNFTTGQTILKDLGVEGMPGVGGMGMGRGSHGDKGGPRNQAEMTALDNADYEAWKSAVQSSPRGTELLAKIDTQDKFNKFVEAHKQMKAGNTTAAQTIFTELGVDLPRSGVGERIRAGRHRANAKINSNTATEDSSTNN